MENQEEKYSNWTISGEMTLTQAKKAALEAWCVNVRFDGSCYIVNGGRKWTYRRMADEVSGMTYKFWEEGKA